LIAALKDLVELLNEVSGLHNFKLHQLSAMLLGILLRLLALSVPSHHELVLVVLYRIDLLLEEFSHRQVLLTFDVASQSEPNAAEDVNSKVNDPLEGLLICGGSILYIYFVIKETIKCHSQAGNRLSSKDLLEDVQICIVHRATQRR